jgi:hypothetical protein
MTRPSLALQVLGVGLLGPGLPDWTTGQQGLREPSGWQEGPTPAAVPQRLAPAERRRAGAPVKISIVVADEALRQSALDPATLATVFSSSSGDTQNCHILCEVLATPERPVSPTRFTNSVHNAAAGYWHIATASRAPSTSLCAFDHSFGAGLLEAASQAIATAQPVMLVAADVPYPAPLHAARPLPASFGVALVLAPAATGTPPGVTPIATLGLSLPGEAVAPSVCDQPALEALRAAVPAARALPLLQALARAGTHEVVIEAAPGLSLCLQVQSGGGAR